MKSLAELPDTTWRKNFSDKIVMIFFHIFTLLSIIKNGKAQSSSSRHTMI